jgi:signal transduction histidine kinase
VNVAATLSVATAGIALGGAAAAWLVGRAQGWRALRWFSLLALCVAVYSAGNVATVLSAPDGVVLVASRLQLAAALLEAWVVLHVADVMAGLAPGPAERWLRWALPLGAALAQLPGLAYQAPVTLHGFPPWGAVYSDPSPTPFGSALFVLTAAGALLAVWRLWRAHRRGVPHAGAYGLSILVLTSLGVNDALAMSRLVEAPYLMDVAALLPVGVLGWSHIVRFLEDAATLEGLRGRLEAQVEQRTRALSQTQAALLGAEKLADFGRFAGGLAHQVNNPAAVVQSGLTYLRGELAEGRVPPDAEQVLRESVEAMQRITALVRRMVDAGRIADRPAQACARVAPLVEAAVAGAQAACPSLQITATVAPGLVAAMVESDLTAVVEALLSNACAAFPPGGRGRVSVTAAARGGLAVIEVVDGGAGMSPEVLQRAFDPFFSTRADVPGAAGLGLPVARSLAEAARGRLELQSREGQGTRAVLEVPEAIQQEETTSRHLLAAPSRGAGG